MSYKNDNIYILERLNITWYVLYLYSTVLSNLGKQFFKTNQPNR